MTHEEIKEKIKDWVGSIGNIPLTVGDLQMFAFDSVIHGVEVEKGVSALANDGFLCYVKSTVKNPFTGEYLPCFKKCN